MSVRAIGINPDFTWSYYSLADALLKLERWEDAIASLHQAMRLDSANSQCYYHLVKVLLKTGHDQLVIACYRPELKFEEAEVYYGLGEVLPKAGQLEESISCYPRALIFA